MLDISEEIHFNSPCHVLIKEDYIIKYMERVNLLNQDAKNILYIIL